MTTIDWKVLKPHVPLGPGDAQYVERTGSAGDEIAQWILADRSPLLVGGPAGVGKSTELARAAELLQQDRVACLVQLDRFENMRRLTPDRMRLRIAQKVGFLAGEGLHLELSQRLAFVLNEVDLALEGDVTELDNTPQTLLDATLAETARLSRQGKLTVLIDGLDKIRQGPGSFDLFEALGALDEDVELVVVIPWHAAFGPQAETIIRSGERFVAVRALDVDGPSSQTGRAFLRNVLAQRLKLDHGLDATEGLVMDEAIRWSGGLPRVFLQLIADAGSYAKLRRSDPWPSAEDLNDAVADQVDSFRRLLLPGDTDAIRAAAGTNGSELDLERKVRLMAHGILLERLRDGARVLDVNPLAQAAFGKGGANA